MSVKARVASSVSDTRKSLILQTDPTPAVKTAVGISYNALSNQIQLIAEGAQKNGGVIPPSDIQKLLDALYQAPRLNQWHHIIGGVYDEFRLYTGNDAMFVSVSVSVTEDRIFLTKGIREFSVFSGMAAQALYSTIQRAQEIVQPASTKPTMTDAEQEEFFAPTDMNGADLDSALADSVDDVEVDLHSVDPEIDDEGLIEEVCKDGTPGQIAIDEDDKVGERVLGDVDLEPKKYSPKLNKASLDDATQVKQEYKDVDPPVKDTANTAVILGGFVRRHELHLARLKSLQGRLLNIVEASFTDKDQRAAVKTLVNKEFRREMNNFNKGSWNGFSALDED